MSIEPARGEVVADFVREQLLFQVLADREAGREIGADEYASRFPGHEALIEAEFRRLLADPSETAKVSRRRHGRGGASAATHGLVLGRYRLLEERGRGAQGSVYLAEDTELGRKVAIKVLSGLGALSERARLRFAREATVVSKLDHPGICPVYDFGEDDGGLFLVMALIEGVTLARAIDDTRRAVQEGQSVRGVVLPAGPGPSDRVARILWTVESIARGLHFAHERGLVHRDIKPGNVMLGEDGQPVLLDFGLAHDEHSEGMTLTHPGELMGTPAYLAPEQIRAVAVGFDPRADVYALGVILYECLTLNRPFQAATREGLYRSVLTQSIPDPRVQHQGLASDVVVILETALEKDVDRRYQSALALAEDLRKVRACLPIAARPPSLGYRLAKFARRNKAVVGGVVGTLAALAIGMIGMTVLWRQSAEHAQRAQWQAYKMSIVAAADAIDEQEDRRAHSYLDAAPAEHRGFEWHYLQRQLVRWQRDLFAPAPIRGELCVDETRREVLAVLADRSIAVWSCGDWELTRERPIDLELGAISPDVVEGRVALGTEAGEVLVWHRDTGSVARVLPASGARVEGVRLSRDGSHLVVARGGAASLVDVATGTLVQTWTGAGLHLPVPLAASASSVAWADRARYSRWVAGQGMEVGGFDAEVPLTTMSVTPDGAIVALGTSADTVLLLQAIPNSSPFRANVLDRLLGHRGAILDTRFSFDGKWLVSVGEDRSLRLWDVGTGGARRVFTAAPYHPARAVLAPDRATLISQAIGEDRALRLWPVRAEPALLVGGLPAPVQRLAVSPDGSVVAAASAGRGIARAWRVGDGMLLREEEGEFATVTGDDWARSEGSPRLREGSVCTEQRLVEAHTGPVRCVAYAPDGRRLATGSDDKTIRIWDTATGEPLLELRGHTGPVTAVVFSGDGLALLSGSTDRTVRLWSGRREEGVPSAQVAPLDSKPPAAAPAARTPAATTGADVGWVEHIVCDRSVEACYAVAADIDGDGDVDILSTADSQEGGDEIAWHEQTAGGFRRHIIARNTDAPRCVDARDLDNDGDIDLVVGSAHTGNVSWFENLGGVPPRFLERILSTTAASVFRVAVADVNGDGLPDVLSASQNDDTVAWFRNDGGSPPIFHRDVISAAAAGASVVYPADLDGDGDLDIVSGSRRDSALRWHENLGGASPRFVEHAIDVGGIADPRMIDVADFDGDGHPDIVVAPLSGTRFSWWQSDGQSPPRFREQLIRASEHPQGLGGVDAVDLDGDGDADIVAAFFKRQWWDGEANRVLWYENDGRSPPAFTEHVVTTARDRPHSAFAADIDGDGALDIVVASRGDNTIAWYRSTQRRAATEATAKRPR